MKILIGLIEHFGDVVACEPVTRYLRQKYDNPHISWAIQKPYRELVDSNPNVNETIELGCLTDWIKLYKHSKSAGTYDVSIDLHVNYRVCEQCRVPLVKEQGNPFVNAFEWFDYGAILEAFSIGAGLPKLSAQPQVYISDEHRRAVDALPLPSEYCVIHREASATEKDWPEENWHSVVRFLTEELKLAVVEVGSRKGRPRPHPAPPEEAPRPTPWGSSVIDIRNRTSLLETAEVIRRAHFYLGIDSGPAHLANAVKTPGVVLLGKLGFFRQYNPFTGFYASNSPKVRIVRNLMGTVVELPAGQVIEAARYLHQVLEDDSASPAAKTSGYSDTPVDPDYRRMVSDSGFFDPAWYVTHYPEAGQNGLKPLDYFLKIGAHAGHAPSSGFDPAWYVMQRPDLVRIENPLAHYLHFGRTEGLRPCEQSASKSTETSSSALYLATEVPKNLDRPQTQSVSCGEDGSLPRIFAFYLPQFHPIAENNYARRPGFTEWDDVINAKPLFKGHYQPRIPGELGYYDLRSLDVMKEQVRLANDHGITGFCFYYYYFQGKKLLYKPIENYIYSDIKAPFFFLWANENWSRRRWEGGKDEVIVSQSHSPADDLVFIRELLPLFADGRYVKVAGKPVLAIQKTHLFPNILKSTERWREEAVKNGLPGLYLLMVDDGSEEPRHPRDLGFDASYEMPAKLVPEEVLSRDVQDLGLVDGFQGRIVDYRKFASYHMGRPFPEYKRFRTVMAPWDDTPRYGPRAMVQTNTDNDSFKLWLAQALVDTHRRYAPDERIVLLHSWNEWGEGTYVEPDGRHGRRFLEEIKEVVNQLEGLVAIDQNLADPRAAVLYQRIMREKEAGAARSLQAMRQQNMYLHREIERTIGDIHQAFYQTKSWRFTKPLRALARILNRSAD